MSYKLKILNDNPLGYWQLDDVAIDPSFNYDDILNRFDTYQDLKDFYETYQSVNYEISDSSGCNNSGLYVGDFSSTPNRLSLVSGGVYPLSVNDVKSMEFPINKNYNGVNNGSQFATNTSFSSPFSLECWVLFKMHRPTACAVLGDKNNNVGIFWENNNIIFKLNQDSLEYTLPYSDRALHIVAVYNVDKAFIYVDGNLVVEKNIVGNPFANTDLLLKSGPTEDIQNEFTCDEFAAYGHALSSAQIQNHFIDDGYTLPIQVVSVDNGELFEFYDNGLSRIFKYSYPLNKSWEYFVQDGLSYNLLDNYLYLTQTEESGSAEIVLEDIISIPSGVDINSSKIEWYGTNGISVLTSTDGVNYTECINKESIPQFYKSNFMSDRILYLKIVISSEDTSRYIPRLYDLDIIFYNNQIMYSKNGGSYYSQIENKDVYLGSQKFPTLSHDFRNGIYVPANSGFDINLTNNIKTIEFFYHPKSLTEGTLLSAEDTAFMWDSSGLIDTSNIDAIYVNSIDKTSQTNIHNVFLEDELHYVVIKFTNPVSDKITFNYSETQSPKALYQYLALYQYELSINQILDHYDSYTGKIYHLVESSTMNIEADSVSVYNNDWLVIQNV